MNIEDQYLQLAERILISGEVRPNRTSTPVKGSFSAVLEHDMRRGFPLLTTKSIRFEKVMAELCGFLAGATSSADFREFGTKIWDENANENEDWLKNPHRIGTDHLGPIYGHQWRKRDSIKLIRHSEPNFAERIDAYVAVGYHVEGSYVADENSKRGAGGTVVLYKQIDQMQELIDTIRRSPFGRRHIVDAWNPSDLAEMALPPCHMMFQCYARGEFLDMQMYQRSADLFLGVPYNIASYAALLSAICMVTGRRPGRLILVLGDVHIYSNHVAQMKTQIDRQPRALPELKIKFEDHIDKLTPAHFMVEGYKPCGPLPATMANN
jgi:thymidylate synthase